MWNKCYRIGESQLITHSITAERIIAEMQAPNNRCSLILPVNQVCTFPGIISECSFKKHIPQNLSSQSAIPVMWCLGQHLLLHTPIKSPFRPAQRRAAISVSDPHTPYTLTEAELMMIVMSCHSSSHNRAGVNAVADSDWKIPSPKWFIFRHNHEKMITEQCVHV